jgi:hypothetical protein
VMTSRLPLPLPLRHSTRHQNYQKRSAAGAERQRLPSGRQRRPLTLFVNGFVKAAPVGPRWLLRRQLSCWTCSLMLADAACETAHAIVPEQFRQSIPLNVSCVSQSVYRLKLLTSNFEIYPNFSTLNIFSMC